MRRISFDECDQPEEVCGWLNKIFENQDQMEAKIVQNAQEIENMKSKKKKKAKGSVLTRLMLVIAIIAIIAGIGVSAYVPNDINYEIASNPEMLATYLRDVTGTMISDSYLFTPTTAANAPPLADGRVWYNNTANILQISLDGLAWTNIALAGGNSLDAAYDVAEEITADSGTPITFTVPDGGNNVGLLITNNDTTNDPDALVIDHNSDLATTTGIQIDSVAGDDIRGTGDVWDVSRTGVGTFVGLVVGASDITLENLDGINNVDDDVIEFWTDDKEDFEFNLAVADTLTLASDTGIVTIAFGPCDDLSGVGNIIFDDAAAVIQQTGTGTNDLTITQLGATTQSLILNSDGNVDDAITVTTLGGIDVDTTLSIVLTSVENTADSIVLQSTIGGIDILCDAAGAGEDIDIANTGGSVNITASEAADAAINIATSNAAGQVVITSTDTTADALDINTTGGVDVDTTDGSVVITAAGAANGDITLDAEDKISVISSDAAAAGILLQVDGGAAETIHINSTAGTSAAAINIDADVGGITLLADGAAAGDILIDAEDRITLTTVDADAGAITIHADTGAAASTIIVTNTAGTAVSVAAAETAAIQLYADAGGIGLNAGIDAVNAIRIEADGGTAETIVVHANQGDTATSITLLSDAGGITLDAGADDNIYLTAGATGAVVFSPGQTRTVTPVVVVDGTVPPSTTAIGTSGQSQIPVYSFDANPDATGDDFVYLLWRVPAGYVVDSADLFFTFSYSTAETDGDDVAFDCTVLAITPGSGAAGGTAFDAAGAAVAALDVDLVNGDGDEGKVMEGTFDIEVTAIAVGDEVIIAFWVDEDQCDLAASGTIDIHNWTITYESTE